jgi:hypothetical protein
MGAKATCLDRADSELTAFGIDQRIDEAGIDPTQPSS